MRHAECRRGTHLAVLRRVRFAESESESALDSVKPRPFTARIRIPESSESSSDADSLAKPEVLSSGMTSHQRHQHRD